MLLYKFIAPFLISDPVDFLSIQLRVYGALTSVLIIDVSIFHSFLCTYKHITIDNTHTHSLQWQSRCQNHWLMICCDGVPQAS